MAFGTVKRGKKKRARLHRHIGFAHTASSCVLEDSHESALGLERAAGLAAVRDTDGIIPLGVGTNGIPGSSGEHLVLMSWEGEVIPSPFSFPSPSLFPKLL